MENAAVEFENYWRGLKIGIAPYPVYMLLAKTYSNVNNVYHNWSHILRCLAVLDSSSLGITAINKKAVVAAIWFHDAVYDPAKSDNEQQSADLAWNLYRNKVGWKPNECDELRQIILDTTHKNDVPFRRFDSRVVCDIDLSILASDAALYNFYASAIRWEYSFVSDDVYRQHRVSALNNLLKINSGDIYYTRTGVQLWKQAAIANINRELDWLKPVEDVAPTGGHQMSIEFEGCEI